MRESPQVDITKDNRETNRHSGVYHSPAITLGMLSRCSGSGDDEGISEGSVETLQSCSTTTSTTSFDPSQINHKVPKCCWGIPTWRLIWRRSRSFFSRGRPLLLCLRSTTISSNWRFAWLNKVVLEYFDKFGYFLLSIISLIGTPPIWYKVLTRIDNLSGIGVFFVLKGMLVNLL